jgi:hypothetical protein
MEDSHFVSWRDGQRGLCSTLSTIRTCESEMIASQAVITFAPVNPAWVDVHPESCRATSFDLRRKSLCAIVTSVRVGNHKSIHIDEIASRIGSPPPSFHDLYVVSPKSEPVLPEQSLLSPRNFVPSIHSPGVHSVNVNVCDTVLNSCSSEPLDSGTSERKKSQSPSEERNQARSQYGQTRIENDSVQVSLHKIKEKPSRIL